MNLHVLKSLQLIHSYKFIENQEFEFDNTFSENETNEELYDCSIKPILDLVFNTGTITIFAYG